MNGTPGQVQKSDAERVSVSVSETVLLTDVMGSLDGFRIHGGGGDLKRPGPDRACA